MVRVMALPEPPLATPWVSKPHSFIPFGVEWNHYRGHYQPRMMTDEWFLPCVRMLCRDIQRRNTCMQLKWLSEDDNEFSGIHTRIRLFIYLLFKLWYAVFYVVTFYLKVADNAGKTINETCYSEHYFTYISFILLFCIHRDRFSLTTLALIDFSRNVSRFPEAETRSDR
jgi:hypothetical protein